MSERSDTISRLRSSFYSRTSYIKAKLGILIPSKIKALRLKSNMPRQRDLAIAAKMHQSRISMFETPGVANLTLETLAKLAAAFKVGLIVEFVPFSEMLDWENRYSQESFDVTRIDEDVKFIQQEPKVADFSNASKVAMYHGQAGNASATTSTGNLKAGMGSAGGAEIAGAEPMRVARAEKISQQLAAGG